MTLKRTGRGVVSIASTRLSSSEQLAGLPKAVRTQLNHMSNTPPMGSYTSSNDTVALLFRNEAGQIGHMANAQGPIEMSREAPAGGIRLGTLAQGLLSQHMPHESFNALVHNTHEQRLIVNGRQAGRVTYVLLNAPLPFMGPPAPGQAPALDFQPLAPNATPRTPGFLTSNSKRAALGSMAVAALQADIHHMNVQLKLEDVSLPAPTARISSAPAPSPVRNVSRGFNGGHGPAGQPPATATTPEAAPAPAATGLTALMNRLGQALKRQIKRGPGGPQSNPA